MKGKEPKHITSISSGHRHSQPPPDVDTFLERLRENQPKPRKSKRRFQFEKTAPGMGRSHTRVMVGGVVLIMLAALAAVAGVLWWMQWRPAGETEPGGANRVVVVEENFDPGKTEDWKGATPEEAVKGFTEAAGVEERLRWVRDAERVAPFLREFFSAGPGAKERVAAVTQMDAVQTEAASFLRYQIALEGGGNRLLCVVIDEEKGAKVDFESYARHGSAEWADLLGGTAREAGEMRLFVEPGNYYNLGFADEGRWRHFIGTSPDLDGVVDLYAERGTDEERRMNAVAGGAIMRATLGIGSVGESFAKRQFQIRKVWGPGWVVDYRNPWSPVDLEADAPPDDAGR